MKALRTPITQTRRDAWTEVNLSNIEFNINEIKKVLAPGVKIMAIVKADAYGHGAAMVSKTLSASGVSMFGVAAVDEGIQLRMTDIKKPVLILGPTPNWAVASAVENDLDITIFSEAHLDDCIEVAQKLQKRVNIHIKIDTGMHRIGVDYRNAPELIAKAEKAREVFIKGIFSHLACAEDTEASQVQINRWNEIINHLDKKPPYLHFTNSAALIAYKNIHYNLVRCGLEIYGLKPDLPPGINHLPLKQVMALRGRINHLHKAMPGEGVSYGYSYNVCDKEVTIATLPVGYADGVSRRLSNKIYGSTNGMKVPQIGNITMDQMMLDVSEINDIAIGDIITLLDADNTTSMSIDDWAKILGTINYEVPCLLKVRLPRVYTSD
ncbi:MAG: alanine racemase [Cyanobacteriota bacterium]